MGPLGAMTLRAAGLSPASLVDLPRCSEDGPADRTTDSGRLRLPACWTARAPAAGARRGPRPAGPAGAPDAGAAGEGASSKA